MATAAKFEPKLTDLTVSYSVGVKANLGNYESADAHLSRTEKWNVEGLTEEEVQAFYDERYEYMRADLGPKVEREYANFLNPEGA